MGRFTNIRGKSDNASENDKPTRKVFIDTEKGPNACKIEPGNQVIEIDGEKACMKVLKKENGEWKVDEDWEGKGIPTNAEVKETSLDGL